MLYLIENEEEKEKLQSTLYNTLTSSLNDLGIKQLGNRGGHDNLRVFSNGKFWYAHQIAPTPNDEKSDRAKRAIKRHWNGFGLPDSESPTVEINIPIESNSAKIAGFFAHKDGCGPKYLMHSGRLGGGKPGIGKAEFIKHSRYDLVEIATPNGTREGIVVSEVGTKDFVTDIQEFVLRAAAFRKYMARSKK